MSFRRVPHTCWKLKTILIRLNKLVETKTITNKTEYYED